MWIKSIMPLVTELVILVLTISAFTKVFQNEYGEALVFGLLIIAAQLQKLNDTMESRKE